MSQFLEPSDLDSFADVDYNKALDMIEDAEALALLAAPCIGAEGFANTAAVKAILRGAVLRWNEAGTGAIQSQTAGPFAQTLDNRQERRGMFWPSEIQQLQNLCSVGGSVYTVGLSGDDGAPSVPAYPFGGRFY